MEIVNTIREHPYWTAGGVFAVGVVAVLMLRGGKSAPAPTSDAAYYSALGQTSAAQIAAGSALQLAQVQTNAASSQEQIKAQMLQILTDAQTTQKQNDNATAVQEMQISAQNGLDIINSNNNVSLANIDANKVIQMGSIDLAKTLGLAGIAETQHNNDLAYWATLDKQQKDFDLAANTNAIGYNEFMTDAAHKDAVLNLSTGLNNAIIYQNGIPGIGSKTPLLQLT